jgi:hypothetical protein
MPPIPLARSRGLNQIPVRLDHCQRPRTAQNCFGREIADGNRNRVSYLNHYSQEFLPLLLPIAERRSYLFWL